DELADALRERRAVPGLLSQRDARRPQRHEKAACPDRQLLHELVPMRFVLDRYLRANADSCAATARRGDGILAPSFLSVRAAHSAPARSRRATICTSATT